MTPHEGLVMALADAVDSGLRIPCAGSEAYVSEDHDVRNAAAEDCVVCPCLTECAAAGDSERWGIWGGTWRGPTTRPAGRPRRQENAP